jgi:hypothetical protein
LVGGFNSANSAGVPSESLIEGGGKNMLPSNLVSISTGPLLGNLMVFAWIDLLTVILVIALLRRLGGGKISYPIALIGLVGIIGFLTMVLAGPEALWVSTILKSVTSFAVALWFVEILKP